MFSRNVNELYYLLLNKYFVDPSHSDIKPDPQVLDELSE